MEERKLKRTPNENSAGNTHSVLLFSEGKGRVFKMLILVQLSDSSLYPPQHLAYCFAYVHNQYLNEWMDAYEAPSSKILYFNSPPQI